MNVEVIQSVGRVQVSGTQPVAAAHRSSNPTAVTAPPGDRFVPQDGGHRQPPPVTPPPPPPPGPPHFPPPPPAPPRPPVPPPPPHYPPPPPPYYPPPPYPYPPFPPSYPTNPVYDRPDTGAYWDIVDAGNRRDVWALKDIARRRLSFREERELIETTFRNFWDSYDQYRILDELASNRHLTQRGREYLWNNLDRIHDSYYRDRVRDSLRWNYPSNFFDFLFED